MTKPKYTILVVDDSWIDIAIVCSGLRNYDSFKAIYAKNLESAKEVVDGAIKIDAILTDHKLLGWERGKDILEMAQDKIPSIPCFMITSHDLDVDTERREKMGLDLFNQVFNKPSNIEHYANVFDTILKEIENK